MTKSATETAIHTIGLDIAKNSFAVHGFDADGRTVVTKDLKRGQVLAWFSKLPRRPDMTVHSVHDTLRVLIKSWRLP